MWGEHWAKMTASFTSEQLQQLTEISRLPPEEQKKILPTFLKTLSPEQITYLQQQQEQTTKQGSTCPFCLISQKQLQSIILYEDDFVMAVFDIRPATKGHTVLFPKRHVADFPSLPEDQAARLFLIGQKLTALLEEIEGCEGVNLFLPNGTAAGQTVDHVLLHLIPRYKDDGLTFSWQGKNSSSEELQKLHEQLAPKLSALTQSQQKEKEPAPVKPATADVFVEDDEEPFADF